MGIVSVSRRRVTRGTTLAAAGVLSYPTGTWTPSVLCAPESARAPEGSYGITATLLAIGPTLNADGTVRAGWTDYLLTLTASAGTTAGWVANGGFQGALTLVGRLFLTDANGVRVGTENRFQFDVEV